ncbi:unnamed protein product, partial [Boreogadus saida]
MNVRCRNTAECGSVGEQHRSSQCVNGQIDSRKNHQTKKENGETLALGLGLVTPGITLNLGLG